MACLDENEVVALASGSLTGPALSNAQEHLDSCTECLDLVAMFQQSSAEDSGESDNSQSSLAENQFVPLSESEEINLNAKEGSTIGRYAVVRAIGRGGMGVVYLARDPNLDRMVAIKLVKPSLKGDERAEHFERRLMREARAMAKLTHPNVLTIFDVGKHQNQVFLASEWVDGSTLEDWIGESTHRWQSVLQPFAGAARGLVAAHAAGLIHRDFKPSNVMVGKDGRVLVFDFGLVKSVKASLDDITTQLSGNFIVGTPAYMSPEQMIGDPADARSDQFSFCASLYESIAGKRPFAGRSLMELLANIKAGKIEEPKNIPKWLWDMLKRGLRRNPEERFPSMSAVLEILEEGLAERRRRTLLFVVGAGVIAAAVAALLFYWTSAVDEDELCGVAEQEIAGVWDDNKRASLHEGMMSGEFLYAKDSLDYVSGYFDEYAVDWQEQKRASCVDTKIGKLQTKERFTRREKCLNRLSVQFGALTTRLQAGDRDSVYHAVTMAQNLAPVSDCSRDRVFVDSRDIDTRTPEALQSHWTDLQILENFLTTKKYEDAELRAQALLEQVVEHRPTEALVSTLLGAALSKQGKHSEAVQALEGAFYAAVAGKDDKIAATATCEIFRIYGSELHDHKSAQRWRQLAKAAVERDGSDEILIRWQQTQAYVSVRKGDWASAETQYKVALDKLASAESMNSTQQSEIEWSLGSLFLEREQAEQAELLFRSVLNKRLEILGAKHPEVAVAKANVARALHGQGKQSEANVLGQESLDSLLESVGEDDLLVGKTLNVLAQFSVAEGLADNANRQLLRALTVKRKVYGKESGQLLSTLVNLMEVDRMRAHYSDLVAHGQEALAIAPQVKNWTALQTQELRLRMAEARLEFGEAEDAQRECQDIQGKAAPALKARLMACMGRAKLAFGDNRGAQKELQSALETLRGKGHRGLAQFALAQAVAGGVGDKATELAQGAAQLFADAGPGWKLSQDKVESWLAGRETR